MWSEMVSSSLWCYMSLLLKCISLCLIVQLAKLSISISHWIIEGDWYLCLLWRKSNNKGTQATLDLAELYTEITVKREKKKKVPCLRRYGDHMIERNCRLQGVRLSIISVARCHFVLLNKILLWHIDCSLFSHEP